MSVWSITATWLANVLASDRAFVGLSVGALFATIVVFAGLYFEYERHELHVFHLAKTRKLSPRDFRTKRIHGPERKHIGSVLVVTGVALEALLGFGIFLSGTIRDAGNEVRISVLKKETAELNERAAWLKKQLAWRELSQEQRRAIADACSHFNGIKVEVSSCMGDLEGYFLATDIISTLGAARPTIEIADKRWTVSKPFGGLAITCSGEADAFFRSCFLGALEKRGGLSSVTYSEILKPEEAATALEGVSCKVSVGAKPRPHLDVPGER